MEIKLSTKTAYLTPDLASCINNDLPAAKTAFFKILKRLNPDFIVDAANKEIITNVFDWCIRNADGAYDPDKGLWIYGNVGTGKTTLVNAVMSFMEKYWLREGNSIKPLMVTAPELCAAYSVDGFSTFSRLPIAIDEVGTEIPPTTHVGCKINVVAHAIRTLYDSHNAFPRLTTTNNTLTQICSFYGEQVFDRIGQLFNLVKMVGKSRRPSSQIWNELDRERI